MKHFSFPGLKYLVAALCTMLFWCGNLSGARAQTEQLGSLRTLESSYGFKDIRLGAYTGEVSHKFIYMDGDSRVDADSCLKYNCNDSTLMRLAGNLSVDMIGVRTFKGRIVNIYLFFKLSDGYKVLSHFLSTYGMFTSRRDSYSDVYYWDTNRVNLALLYAVHTDMGVAIFTSKGMQNELAARKMETKKKDVLLMASE